jgi:hypothetical protein
MTPSRTRLILLCICLGACREQVVVGRETIPVRPIPAQEESPGASTPGQADADHDDGGDEQQQAEADDDDSRGEQARDAGQEVVDSDQTEMMQSDDREDSTED